MGASTGDIHDPEQQTAQHKRDERSIQVDLEVPEHQRLSSGREDQATLGSLLRLEVFCLWQTGNRT